MTQEHAELAVAALTEKQDKPLKLEESSPLSERIERERERIMRAMAVIDVCRRATASMYDSDDPEMMAGALATASDLLNSVAGALEGIAKATPG